ncbi:hypothetical protein CLV30_11582 [Haloactinopolyspora alba]|uniref:PIN domain-containing protein n=1 Tax=Haloactinopolyspora alba TaxID=648780 RepID=A0A2P8DVB3_9ACTN|nr:hypothetical protein [Haloactinopolyspora alba]PSL01146.1 hypothetical protein CLV30_11582 [Haloactinopolyspora alba]
MSSRLAYPEVRTALAAARAVELTDVVTVRSGQLAARHSLRGADAVHVASLLAIGASSTLFAVWDQRLRAGAQAAGVPLAPMQQGGRGSRSPRTDHAQAVPVAPEVVHDVTRAPQRLP